MFFNDRGVYDNLNSTLRSADLLMIDLKLHLKRYVHFLLFGKKDNCLGDRWFYTNVTDML
ncbi:hypothetical protein [Prevotellamassilia timonensis]|uniref:hypothetical protein n=1 Tax=Prevotellamassilia timonensis TaxID=1852370 RepID=UPI0023EFE50B|nr:hypothetical protein [Prevotellamassilia timonensis]